MSSASPIKSEQNAPSMSRERSSESILNDQSQGSHLSGPWLSSPAQGAPFSISGSLFGAAGSAAAARMRTRTESPLFESEEYDLESRETEELLASDATQGPPPPRSSTSLRSSKGLLSSSLPTASAMTEAALARNRPIDSEIPRQSRAKHQRRRGSKPSSMLGSILPNTSDEFLKSKSVTESRPIVQELIPVSTSKEDREILDLYPSAENYEGRISSELDSEIPPPLPPRPAPEPVHEELETIQESEKEPTWPVVQTREELIDRLVDIICGRPESGAHRFRIITIQMATELLIEFVSTKVGNTKDKDQASASHNQGSSGVDNQLSEARLDRLSQAETQLRGRVQKGIRWLEKMKRRDGNGSKQPLGMLTSRVERALNDSNCKSFSK